MSASIAEAVRQLVHNKGISEDLILTTVEEVLLVAYKKKFGTSENAVTKIDEERGEVFLYSKKEVVDEVENELTEISLQEAKEKNSECEICDEVLVEIKPTDLGRIAAQTAKQIVFQRLKEIEKNVLFSEFSQKIGQLITGHHQREKNGHIFVDLGRAEAILPKNEQSPKEIYTTGERIKALILDVQNNRRGTQIVLSRANPLFVQRLFEFEVPEITEGTIQIKSIVRDAGFRTKLSVASRDIDPVGACVGMKGMRIQLIVKELEGEKIDIVRYNENIREYIANALSPAKVEQTVILNEEQKEALAVVSDDQLSLAIGKQGQNVRLAAKLTGWNIDIKTMTEFKELNYEDESRRMVEDLFIDQEEEAHGLSEIPDFDEQVITVLEENDITSLEELVEKSREELLAIDGIDEEVAQYILDIIQENVVVMDEDEMPEEVSAEISDEEAAEVSEEGVLEKQTEEGEEEEVYTYHCPECNTELKEGIKKCPGCGVELEFV